MNILEGMHVLQYSGEEEEAWNHYELKPSKNQKRHCQNTIKLISVLSQM